MQNVNDVVRNYMAVWNEPNADERRRRIQAVWAPDGTTCYRLLDARGYEAIEGRVQGTWDKWMTEGKYVFKPRKTLSHHNAVKFDWAMETVPGGTVEANGLCFLLLKADGHVQHDYQFNPSENDAERLVERYLAVLSASDPQARREKIRDLWAPDGELITEGGVRTGLVEIEAEVAAAHESCVATGGTFSSANRSHGHHNLAKLSWNILAKDREHVVATVSNLLILDDQGKICVDYQFREPAQGQS